MQMEKQKTLSEKIIEQLQDKYDSFLGVDGEKQRQAFKSGLSWAIDTINTLTEIDKIEKESKDGIKERDTNFGNKVLKINCDNDILSISEVINTNGTSFIEYWTEHGENDRKMRFEKQASFDIKRRLLTWRNNKIKFNGKPTYEDKLSEYLNRKRDY